MILDFHNQGHMYIATKYLDCKFTTWDLKTYLPMHVATILSQCESLYNPRNFPFSQSYHHSKGRPCSSQLSWIDSPNFEFHIKGIIIHTLFFRLDCFYLYFFKNFIILNFHFYFILLYNNSCQCMAKPYSFFFWLLSCNITF